MLSVAGMSRFLAICLAFGATGAALGQPLAVHIDDPHAGVVLGPVVQLSAHVSDPALRHATLVVNGAAYDVPVESGRVEQEILAVPGNNRVALMVARGAETARDSLTFRYDGPPMELVVLLSWPSEGEIIDLWVREPGGETCKWDQRSTESGGTLLDFSTNAIGFGSQGYTLGEVRPGRYRLKVHYWGTAAHDDQRSGYSYEAMLGELDEVIDDLASSPTDALRRRESELREGLDRWSSPVAPQTRVHAEAILFPGTPFERRWRFDRVVGRTGELMTLGEIDISEVMIRHAREATR